MRLSVLHWIPMHRLPAHCLGPARTRLDIHRLAAIRWQHFGIQTRLCHAAADDPRAQQCHLKGRWETFSDKWNETLTRRPMPMVIFFSGAVTLTWAAIFGALSCSAAAGSTLAAPELAVGWLVMRVTSRLRMPVNAAAAALVSGLCPALSSLRISPLLAAFAGSAEADDAARRARRSLERSPSLSPRVRRLLRRCFRAFGRWAQWAEGPIDRYGLSYYVVAKTTGVLTFCGATVAAMHGLDVPGALSRWGLSGELQADAGLFACAAAINVPCAPLHFLGAVGAVDKLERMGARIWLEKQLELDETERQNGRLSEEEQLYKELSEADVKHNFVTNMAYLTLLIDLGFSLYIMRRMSKSQAKRDLAKVDHDEACQEPQGADAGTAEAGEVSR